MSRRFGRKIGRNSCAQTLKKFSYVQEKIIKRLLNEIVTTGNGKTSWYIIVDDTLVNKIGKTIFRSLKWFNHTVRRQIQTIGLVTLVFVVDKLPVFFMPWILSSPKQNSFYASTPDQQQRMKVQAAQTMILFIIDHLITKNITKKHIFVEADSWYGTKKMRKFLTNLKVNYRLDGKKSYSVQIPDFEAIKQSQVVTRGRKRKQFVKYVKNTQYFGPRETWKSFLDLESGSRVYFKTEQLTLKNGGQSLVYAFWDKRYQNPKFILTDVKRLRKSSPKTIYYQYHLRWIIEVCHRQLKQEFGLTKSQNRDAWVVSGFIGFVCLAYLIWSFQKYKNTKDDKITLSCPSWANYFHEDQIIQSSG